MRPVVASISCGSLSVYVDFSLAMPRYSRMSFGIGVVTRLLGGVVTLDHPEGTGPAEIALTDDGTRDELIRVLRRWIAPRISTALGPASSAATEIDAMPETRPASPVAAAPAEVADGALPVLPGFDLDSACLRLGGDRVLLRRLMQTFAGGYADAGARLRAAFAQPARSELVRLLHTLKGASGSIGATGLQAESARLETLLRGGGEPGDIEALSALLDATLATLAWYLDETATPAAAAVPVRPPASASLSASLRELQDLLGSHRLVPDALTARVRGDCGGHEVAIKLLTAVDNFDYEQASKYLEQLIREYET